MATPTVKHSRAHALMRRIAQLDAEPGRREAVALGLVDAAARTRRRDAGRAPSTPCAMPARGPTAIRSWSGGWTRRSPSAHWGLERVPSQAAVAQGTQAHDFLRVLDGSPQLGSAELRRLLEIDETQVSRTGRRLLESGLVTRSKVGRQVFWQLTPRGRRGARGSARPAAIAQLGVLAGGPPTRLRRGLRRRARRAPRGRPHPRADHRVDARAAQQPGHPGDDVAGDRRPAGVPVETVEALFPTLDDLVQELRRAPDGEPAAAAARPSARGLRRRRVGARADPPPGRDVLRRLRARSGRHHGRAPRAQGRAGGGRVDGRARRHRSTPSSSRRYVRCARTAPRSRP